MLTRRKGHGLLRGAHDRRKRPDGDSTAKDDVWAVLRFAEAREQPSVLLMWPKHREYVGSAFRAPLLSHARSTRCRASPSTPTRSRYPSSRTAASGPWRRRTSRRPALRQLPESTLVVLSLVSWPGVARFRNCRRARRRAEETRRHADGQFTKLATPLPQPSLFCLLFGVSLNAGFL